MAASWDSHKGTLRTLYIDRGETLKSIMACMKEFHGFAMRCGNKCSRIQSYIKSLTFLQQGPVRAAIQEVGLSQKQ
jgi:hypothetical protein